MKIQISRYTPHHNYNNNNNYSSSAHLLLTTALWKSAVPPTGNTYSIILHMRSCQFPLNKKKSGLDAPATGICNQPLITKFMSLPLMHDHKSCELLEESIKFHNAAWLSPLTSHSSINYDYHHTHQIMSLTESSCSNRKFAVKMKAARSISFLIIQFLFWKK